MGDYQRLSDPSVSIISTGYKMAIKTSGKVMRKYQKSGSLVFVDYL